MIDRYTKAVLTVIASALTLLVIQNAMQPAIAQGGVAKVQICGSSAFDCASVFKFDQNDRSANAPRGLVVLSH